MFSVTSEAAANTAFQAAPHWSARSDQPPANDLFGALVNNSAAADSATAAPPPPPQRRTDDTRPPADNAGPANAASNQAANNDPNSNANAGPPSDINANNTNAGSPPGAAASQPSQTKSSDAPKGDPAKSTDKSTDGNTSAVDLTILAQQAALSATTPNPVAVAIPVTTAPTNVPAAATSGNSTAPLAIAAAAIAASTQAVSAQAVSSTQTNADSKTAATDTAAATTTATAADSRAATAKAAISAAASEAVATPAIQQATQVNATPVNAAALTSTVAATVPVTPKAAAGKSPAATDGSTTTSGAAEPSATNAPGAAQNGLLQQPLPTGKPENTNAAVEAATADATASSAITAHEHSPAAGTGHTLADSTDPGTQATGTFQPQLNTPAAAAAPGAALSVTAPTNGPVPLSGLALEIAASAKSGKSRFEIRLDPADLGRIDVRIDIDRNGQVTSHLTVEKPETLSMLRQDAPQLQRALDDAGFKTGNGGLQFSLRDQSSSGQNNGSDANPNAQRLVISEEDTIPAAVAGRTYGRALGPSSGVDIRV